MRENGNRLARVAVDQISQAPCALVTKIAPVSPAERIECNQPDRVILDRIIEKIGAAKISVSGEGRVQIDPIIPVSGEHIDRSARFREHGCCLGILVFAPVVHDVSGVHDHIGSRIERVQVRDGEREIA